MTVWLSCHRTSFSVKRDVQGVEPGKTWVEFLGEVQGVLYYPLVRSGFPVY